MAPLQMGPLATEGQFEHVQRQVRGAVEAGARLVHGGQRPAQFNKGWFYEPTVLTDVRKGMPAYDEELRRGTDDDRDTKDDNPAGSDPADQPLCRRGERRRRF